MDEKYTVAIIGCGRLGQHYAEVYQTLPNTELVAIAEYNPERRQAVGERFGVRALYQDAQDLFRHVVPDIAVVVLPGKYIKEAVIAAAQAGVKGVSTDKPIEARLSDVDAMVEECETRGVVFAGGNLQRAMSEVQEAAGWLRTGEYGPLRGASVHGWGGEISGGGCQHIAVLRLFAQAEVTQVTAWGTPPEALARDDDEGLIINGQFSLSNGLVCPVFGQPTPSRGVDVWTDDALVRWDWGTARDFPRPRRAGCPRKDRPSLHPTRIPPLLLHGHFSAVVFGCIRKRRRAVHLRPRPTPIARSGHCRQVLGAVGQCAARPATRRPLTRALSEGLSLARRRPFWAVANLRRGARRRAFPSVFLG